MRQKFTQNTRIASFLSHQLWCCLYIQFRLYGAWDCLTNFTYKACADGSLCNAGLGQLQQCTAGAIDGLVGCDLMKEYELSAGMLYIWRIMWLPGPGLCSLRYTISSLIFFDWVYDLSKQMTSLILPIKLNYLFCVLRDLQNSESPGYFYCLGFMIGNIRNLSDIYTLELVTVMHWRGSHCEYVAIRSNVKHVYLIPW